jgi:hypothetical protein
MPKILFLSLLIPLQVFANSDLRTVSVSGNCIKKVSPDRGTVTLVAQYTEKTAQVASQKAMATYEKIRQAVQKMKLKDLELQTSEYSVQEQFDYVNNKSVSRGMRASLGLQITTSEISKLGDVIALSQTLEINRVTDLSTFLSAEKSKETREDCLVEAIKNARSKAEKMAESAKAKVGNVQLIDENPNRSTGNESAYAMMDEEASPQSRSTNLAPGIESKPELVSVNVLVKFELK